MREQSNIDLSHGWEFLRAKPKKSWLLSDSDVAPEKLVDLPHCWNALDAFQDSVDYYQGWGAYKRNFHLDANTDDVQWYLKSDGFYGTGDIWLNRRKIADVDGTYLGFCIPVSEHLLFKTDNLLAVRLTNKCASHVLPGIKDPDFLLYGGLSCGVRLESVPLLSIQENSLSISTSVNDKGDASLCVNCVVGNASMRSRIYSIAITLTAPDGSVVEEAGVIEGEVAAHSATGNLAVTIPVEEPALWSCDDPNLYSLKAALVDGGFTVDALHTTVGIRDAVFRPDEGFFLNGKRLYLKGCNRHESMPGFGRALPEKLQREDAALIKSMGLNFVRLSHYPQSPHFLTACDELGILVYAEIASWKSVRTGRWLRNASRQFNEMIRRDRNHPSVILWGIGNESRSRRAFRVLGSIASDLDPSRPVIYAENHMYRARRKRTVNMTAVWGCNYEIDMIEAGRDSSELRNVIVSECSNYPDTVRGDCDKELKQIEQIERDLLLIRDKPYVAGFALWCFNDYATLRKRRYKRYSGLVDAWRLPKMSGALLLSMFSEEPFVKIFADWSQSGTGSREVHIFSNCDELVLSSSYGASVSLSGKTHYVENIEFGQGELQVRGVKGTVKVSDSISSYAEGKALDVWVEVAEADEFNGSLKSLMIRVLDSEGSHDLSWSGEADVEVTGPGRLRSYNSDGKVVVAGGLGRFFVEVLGEGEDIRVKVSSESLEVGKAVIEV